MSIVGMIVMWVFTGLVFLLLSRWAEGKEGNRRTEYWEKYEGK
jgi:hypothetical protein